MAVAGALAAPAAVYAHPDGVVAPQDLLRTWTFDLWVLAGVFVPAWLYVRGIRTMWARAGVGRGVRRWQVWCFAGGVAALFVALVSPLDALGATLFSAHMLQHMVLMLVAAPLMVLGSPLIAFTWALPPVWRQRFGAVARNPDVRGVWYVFSNPFAAWLLHATAIWVWHVPVLYQATLYSGLVHFAQHAAFFVTALLFWWAAVELGKRQRLRYGFSALFVFTTALHTSILGALLTFTTALWYPIYAERTLAWGLTPLEDQQLGGLLMWVPAGVVYLVAALALLAICLTPGAGENVRSRRPAAVIGLSLVLLLLPVACESPRPRAGEMRQVVGGDPHLGPAAIRRYGCVDCHVIPGVRGANAWVGPPLIHWADRGYIAGLLPNTPDNLIGWIQDPQRIHPGSAMPAMGVTLDDARHIAAYLYTIR